MSVKGIRAALVIAIGAAAGLTGAACDSAPADSAALATIDTVGGVVRVRNASRPAGADTEAFTLGERVRIGGGLDADESVTFGRVTGVTLLEGRIYVADGQSRDIRVFDRAGRFLFRFGRQGEGPGEFRAIDAVAAAPGGTVLARDPRLFRVTRFDTEGRYVADYRLSRPYPQYGDGGGFRVAHDGWFYDRLSLTLGIASNDSLAIVVYDDTGHARDTVIVAETSRLFVSVVSDGIPRGGLPVPFAPFASAAVGPDGRIARTLGETFAFDVLADGGVLERTIELDTPLRPVTAGERDSVLDVMRKQAGEMTDGQGRMEDFQFPATKAAITHLLADADGFWWVGANYSATRFRTPDRFEIFDADGVHRGSLSIGLRPIEIGHDYIAGVETDEFGVESVVVIALHRGDVPD